MQERFENINEHADCTGCGMPTHVDCPEAVLHFICFTLTNDPSVRMRRAAMSLLEHVKVRDPVANFLEPRQCLVNCCLVVTPVHV